VCVHTHTVAMLKPARVWGYGHCFQIHNCGLLTTVAGRPLWF